MPGQLKNCFDQERKESPAHVPYKKFVALAHHAVNVGYVFVLTNKSQAGCSQHDTARTACFAECGSSAVKSAAAAQFAIPNGQMRRPAPSSERRGLRGILDAR